MVPDEDLPPGLQEVMWSGREESCFWFVFLSFISLISVFCWIEFIGIPETLPPSNKGKWCQKTPSPRTDPFLPVVYQFQVPSAGQVGFLLGGRGRVKNKVFPQHAWLERLMATSIMFTIMPFFSAHNLFCI